MHVYLTNLLGAAGKAEGLNWGRWHRDLIFRPQHCGKRGPKPTTRHLRKVRRARTRADSTYARRPRWIWFHIRMHSIHHCITFNVLFYYERDERAFRGLRSHRSAARPLFPSILRLRYPFLGSTAIISPRFYHYSFHPFLVKM